MRGGCRGPAASNPPVFPMQRMLIGLVLLLTVAVAVLGLVTFNLQSEIAPRRRDVADSRAPVATPVEPAAAAVDVERVANLERKIRNLEDALAAVRRAARAPTPSRPAPGSDAPGAPSAAGGDDGNALREAAQAYASHDDETGFDVSEAEMDYFTAVQRQVERRRRIDANTSNTVRRIERLVSRGEIAAIAEESKPAVEAIVRRFSVSQEDLMNRYLRQPTGSLQSLGHQERRDLHRQELEKVLVGIRQDLAAIVGEADASKISDSTLASPWGVRNNPRLAGRDNR